MNIQVSQVSGVGSDAKSSVKNSEFGLKIAYYRKRRGLTQEQIRGGYRQERELRQPDRGEQCGGRKGVSLETLFLISEKLDAPWSALFED